MPALPCKHEERVTQQVQPTVHLLSNMDVLHPDILLQHGTEPADYNGSLVFRSAVESIRGRFAASSTTSRQALVGTILENLVKLGHVNSYKQTSSSSRCDFQIAIERDPDYFAAIEVKGGEGNSINISDRPLWAREFSVWCHLDGAIINQPAHGAHAIINRLTNELTRRHKLVDVLFFKDILCGTRTRPCPKYPGQEATIGVNTAPDVFLFPQRIPSLADPEPPTHTLESVRLPSLVLEVFGVPTSEHIKHIWYVQVKIAKLPNGRLQRIVQVRHQGSVVAESRSRQWHPEE